MKTALAVIGGAAVGAGLMYVADPRSGRRRRALIRDAAVHSARVAARRAERHIEIPRHWTPATRILAAAAGISMAASGVKTRGAAGIALVAAATGLLARAVFNVGFKRLLGAAAALPRRVSGESVGKLA